jgi:hypothetical protein
MGLERLRAEVVELGVGGKQVSAGQDAISVRVVEADHES